MYSDEVSCLTVSVLAKATLSRQLEHTHTHTLIV